VNHSLSKSLLLAGALVLAVAGCQQTTPKSPPGALPSAPPLDRSAQISATTYFAHAHLLERQGQFERAVVQYERALKAQPKFVTALNRLGITLNKLGRHAEASKKFQRAIELRPHAAHLQNNLGFSLYLEGRYQQAEAALNRALQLAPHFPRARMNRALVRAKLGRFETVFEDLEAAGNYANACFNMGMLLTDAGRYADAADYLERALSARPKFEAARTQLHEVARLAAQTEQQRAADLAKVTADVLADQNATQTQDVAIAAVTPASSGDPEAETVEQITAVANDAVEPDAASQIEPCPALVEGPATALEEPSGETSVAADSEAAWSPWAGSPLAWTETPITEMESQPEGPIPQRRELSATGAPDTNPIELAEAVEPAPGARSPAAPIPIIWTEPLVTAGQNVLVGSAGLAEQASNWLVSRFEAQEDAAVALEAPLADGPESDRVFQLILQALDAEQRGDVDAAAEYWCRLEEILFPDEPAEAEEEPIESAEPQSEGAAEEAPPTQRAAGFSPRGSTAPTEVGGSLKPAIP
jgi:tetratricopeptide (TPR) repeat protein